MFPSLFWIGIFVGLGFGLGMVVIDSIQYVTAQSEKKHIKLADTVNSQLKFSEVKLGYREQKLGESFDAEPDWIKDLAFKLENISTKRIIFLQVNVNFPETRLTGNLMSYGITYGQRPDSKRKQLNKPMSLQPGGILDVNLATDKDKLFRFVKERQPIESIRKVELEIGFIIFDDKTAWTAGTFLRQDPDNPQVYKPIENVQK